MQNGKKGLLNGTFHLSPPENIFNNRTQTFIKLYNKSLRINLQHHYILTANILYILYLGYFILSNFCKGFGLLVSSKLSMFIHEHKNTNMILLIYRAMFGVVHFR